MDLRKFLYALLKMDSLVLRDQTALPAPRLCYDARPEEGSPNAACGNAVLARAIHVYRSPGCGSTFDSITAALPQLWLLAPVMHRTTKKCVRL